MSEQIYNDQVMTLYLLGALPETEAERLDELSVTDQAFAEALSAAEKELVDAYVRGELPAPALEQFKSHYLASPRRRDRVKFAEAFQLFAERMSPATEPVEIDAPTAKARQTPGRRSSWSSVFAPRLLWQWSVAAALIILIGAGIWLAFENIRLRQQAAQAHGRRDEILRREQELQTQIDAARSANSAAEQELAKLRSERERLEQGLEKPGSGRTTNSTSQGGVVAFNLAPPLRAVAQVPTISVPPGTGSVSMQLQLEPNDYASYRVSLLNQAHQQTVWRSGQLKAKPGRNGKALGVSFGAGLLEPQTVYVLRVTGIAAGGAAELISDYSFKVAK